MKYFISVVRQINLINEQTSSKQSPICR